LHSEIWGWIWELNKGYENFRPKYIIVYISSTAGTQKAPVGNSKLKGVGEYKYVSSKLEQC
jgi:hypothetical protein